MNRATKTVFLILIFSIAPFLLAMGMLGDPQARRKAPEPEMRLDALLVDMEETSTKVTHVSYDGELYLPAYRGKGLITIPFEKIRRIEFGEKEGTRRQATVFFKDDKERNFRVEDKILFVGKLAYGTYQIQVKDLKSIELIDPKSTGTDSSHGR